MANWTTNILKLRGSVQDIQSIKESYFSYDEVGLNFDFNKVIPIPKELEDTNADFLSTSIHDFLETDMEKSLDNFKVYLCQLKGWDLSESSSFFEELTQERWDKCILLYQNHHSTDWYHWRINNWGTKWESDSTCILNESDTELEIEFMTAWSHPLEIYQKIQEIYTNISITYEAQHEGGFGGEVGAWNSSENKWETFQTQEVYYGINEIGEECILHWDGEMEELVDSDGNIYEDYEVKFEVVD
jgi:hypothetical protein